MSPYKKSIQISKYVLLSDWIDIQIWIDSCVTWQEKDTFKLDTFFSWIIFLKIPTVPISSVGPGNGSVHTPPSWTKWQNRDFRRRYSKVHWQKFCHFITKNENDYDTAPVVSSVKYGLLCSILKVRKFQNENMKSSHCPEYERKIWKILPWILRAEFFKLFRSYFGQCDDFIFSFGNLLTFSSI